MLGWVGPNLYTRFLGWDVHRLLALFIMGGNGEQLPLDLGGEGAELPGVGGSPEPASTTAPTAALAAVGMAGNAGSDPQHSTAPTSNASAALAPVSATGTNPGLPPTGTPTGNQMPGVGTLPLAPGGGLTAGNAPPTAGGLPQGSVNPQPAIDPVLFAQFQAFLQFQQSQALSAVTSRGPAASSQPAQAPQTALQSLPAVVALRRSPTRSSLYQG